MNIINYKFYGENGEDGEHGEHGEHSEDGEHGEHGEDGENGENGESGKFNRNGDPKIFKSIIDIYQQNNNEKSVISSIPVPFKIVGVSTIIIAILMAISLKTKKHI
jgi:hypothetical protein